MPKCTEKYVNFRSLFLFLFFISCTNNIANLTLASTKDVDISIKYNDIGIVEGGYSIPWILMYPMGAIRIDKAIQKTINNNNIDYLTDISIDQSFWHPYLFGQTTIKVNGVGWRKIETKFDPLTGEPIN